MVRSQQHSQPRRRPGCVPFRDPHVPKGQISINAERGAVFLRGQVEGPELIDDLAASVRKIHGVSEVVDLLHLPGTEAPHASPRASDARRRLGVRWSAS